MRVPLIYKDRPVFGVDIGSRSVKIVQLKPGGKKPRVLAFSSVNFPIEAIVEGIVADPDLMVKAIRPMLSKADAGHFTAKRAVFGLPASKVFIRTLQLPPMSQADLEQAVRFEAEQYVPVPINDLYIDYETFKPAQTDKDKEAHVDVLMVAAPRAIVDSYIKLFDLLDLELASIETTLRAVARSVMAGTQANDPVLIVDLGSRSADLVVFHQVMRLVGTVSVGGDDLTSDMVKILKISPDQANEIKYKFGIAPSGLQPKIVEAIGPKLQTLVAEIKKIIKFYQDRSEEAKINKVVLSGGGANLPGLVEYLSKSLGLQVELGDPWAGVECKLPLPDKLEMGMFSTAIGLAERGDKI